MKRRLFAVFGVMLLAFFLLLVFPDAGMSASVLSEQEMGAIQGGCSGRCSWFTCGTHEYPCESGIGDTCNPNNPEELCNNLKIVTDRVINCGGYATGVTCYRGELTPCGERHQCWCRLDVKQCLSYQLEYHYEYWSGCDQNP